MNWKLFLVAVLGLSLVLLADDAKKSQKSSAKATKAVAKTEKKASGGDTASVRSTSSEALPSPSVIQPSLRCQLHGEMSR